MDAQKTARFMESIWDSEIIPGPDRLYPHPQQEPGLRSRLGKPWPYGTGGRPVRGLGAGKTQSPARRERWKWYALAGRTPLILIEVPGTADGTILMYGHLDKQPEMKGWTEGTGPWMPRAERRETLWPGRRR